MPRRVGAVDSGTRTTLLDVTRQLMLEEGYAAVSSRRVAERAGVAPALVHYYFPTLDDLFIAVIRRGADENVARLAELGAGEQPLRAIWDFDRQPTGTRLLLELMALANHRKAVRAEIAAYAERFRDIQVEVVARALAERGVDLQRIPPVAVEIALEALARVLVLEQTLGVTRGHATMAEVVDAWLGRLEGAPTGGAPRLTEEVPG